MLIRGGGGDDGLDLQLCHEGPIPCPVFSSLRLVGWGADSLTNVERYQGIGFVRGMLQAPTHSFHLFGFGCIGLGQRALGAGATKVVVIEVVAVALAKQNVDLFWCKTLSRRPSPSLRRRGDTQAIIFSSSTLGLNPRYLFKTMECFSQVFT